MATFPAQGLNPWRQALLDWLRVSHNDDGTLIAGTIPSAVYKLASGPSAAATSITIDRSPSELMSYVGGFVVIDPFTSQCEVRAVAGVSSATITVAALTYSHSTNDTVFWVPTASLDVKWFGAKGDDS